MLTTLMPKLMTDHFLSYKLPESFGELKILFSVLIALICRYIASGTLVLQRLYKDDRGLILTYFTARSILVT